jgi:hypothetical protein
MFVGNRPSSCASQLVIRQISRATLALLRPGLETGQQLMSIRELLFEMCEVHVCGDHHVLHGWPGALNGNGENTSSGSGNTSHGGEYREVAPDAPWAAFVAFCTFFAEAPRRHAATPSSMMSFEKGAPARRAPHQTGKQPCSGASRDDIFLQRRISTRSEHGERHALDAQARPVKTLVSYAHRRGLLTDVGLVLGSTLEWAVEQGLAELGGERVQLGTVRLTVAKRQLIPRAAPFSSLTKPQRRRLQGPAKVAKMDTNVISSTATTVVERRIGSGA